MIWRFGINRGRRFDRSCVRQLVLNLLSGEFGHPCEANQRLQHGDESPERSERIGLVADSGRSRNAAKFSRIGPEEVFQSLRTATRDRANCIGSAASFLVASSFSGSKVSPKTRKMIERVRIDVTSHGLGSLLIRDADVLYRALKRSA